MIDAVGKPRSPSGPAKTLSIGGRPEKRVEERFTSWVSLGVGGQSFALPVERVQEVLRTTALSPDPEAPFPIRGVIPLRDHKLPVIDLGMRLGLETGDFQDGLVVVVSSQGRLIGLLVERVEQILSIRDGTVERLPHEATTHQSYYLLGICPLEGRFVILLDLDQLLLIRD